LWRIVSCNYLTTRSCVCPTQPSRYVENVILYCNLDNLKYDQGNTNKPNGLLQIKCAGLGLWEFKNWLQRQLMKETFNRCC
jgi:hypothetical protein